MRPNLTIFENPAALADRVSDRLIEQISKSSGRRFDLAISGGSTPNFLFSALASKYPDSVLWQKTHFWWVDERMVPSDDPESNFGTVQKLLFSKIEIPKENIHYIHGDANPLQESENYSILIQQNLSSLDGWPEFDLILLGMGEDGHTASIFPDQIGLMHSDRICEVAHHPVTNQARITLTGKVVNNAAKIWFLVTGSGKAERLAEIIGRTKNAPQLPASYIDPVHGELCWFLDEPASSSLSQP